MNVKTRERLETMKHRYNEINSLLSHSDINNNIELLTKLSKERAKLNDTVLLYMKYLSIESNLQEIKNIFQNEKDADLLNLAKEELKGNEESLLFVEQQLTIALLPANPNDDKNVIIEIRGAVGGDEANIFAGDLYQMYLRYCESQNWKTELLDARISNSGGFSQISFLIKGEKVYAKMKFEAGSHRVQRIPKTESQGRIHTSTATVVILPEASALDVDVKPSELKIDTYRASGAGGQHVNTTDSAVRITHLPTGIVATSQDGRSQHDNKDKALKVLLAKIYEAKLEAQQSEMGRLRKIAVGSGVRAEKIRTYNYPQNRVSDHRINLTLNKLDRIMLGELNEIINALIDDEQKRKMGMED
ncbi:peptide chain release factor 1 [Spiroplasma endosymbiont of 'Nebria riversi']|uniref:peptide chain release factor 1 n=1 Tax=Spiroplasma endosymbiont of 'Nebria riversi' TaxID=2792084 RepID=UPI001C05E59A|nr:peptide chain release factor 1 [Spiroplasma endosymbiont of 'Nebria riversi']